ncbi:MAG: YkgJ family cysteine cluster protein [Desulfatibacillaceae bacterium]
MSEMTQSAKGAGQKACRRCGTCCARGGPALHKQDVSLVEDGVVSPRDLVTVRHGEPVFDFGKNRYVPLQGEIIKIRGGDAGWACRFHHPEKRACAIYSRRPSECAAMKCWDTSEIEAMYAKGRITRLELLSRESDLLAFMARHDRRCSYARLGRLVRMLEEPDAEKAQAAIIDTVEFDENARREVVERFGKPADAVDFFLGRQITYLLDVFGLRVRDAGGKKFLVRARAGDGEPEG